SLIKALLKNSSVERGPWVNLLSLAESANDRNEAQRLLQGLGLEVLALPDGAAIQDFKKAADAKFSVPLDFDAGHYLGRAFRDIAQVPLLDVPRPISLVGTRQWLLAAGAAAGKEDEATELHAREAAALAEILRAQPLRGAKVYLSLAPATALGLLDLVKEIGGQVAGLTVSHVDQLHTGALRKFQEQAPALQIHVGDGQGFEEANLLQRLKPDLYVGDGGHISQAARLGIPSLYLPRISIVGYRGVREFARRAALALKNRSFVARFAGGAKPFTENWFQRSPNWHIKQEVK
ncbi:MAG TPA: nitrogenase component 1, partial [Verrucomicrobiae bacterium]